MPNKSLAKVLPFFNKSDTVVNFFPGVADFSDFVDLLFAVCAVSLFPAAKLYEKGGMTHLRAYRTDLHVSRFSCENMVRMRDSGQSDYMLLW